MKFEKMNLIFDPNAQMSKDGGSLRGYLYDHHDVADPTWTFQNVLARLNRLCEGNQVIFDDGNFDKSSFTVTGTYKGEYFDLYDYKGDQSIHVGGGQNLDVNGLTAELKTLINQTEPKAFDCRCSYTYQKYSYP